MSKYQNNLNGTYFENYEELEVIGSGSYGKIIFNSIRLC